MSDLSQVALEFCKIPIGNGIYAIVDIEDYEYLMQWSWHASKRNGRVYATRSIEVNDKHLSHHMHAIIMKTPKGMDTDHRDGDGLNNRKSNLRIATRAQNSWNRNAPATGKSRYFGVYWHKKAKKWAALIKSNGETTYLGLFSSEDDAATAYNMVALRDRRGFARLNNVGPNMAACVEASRKMHSND